MYKLRIGNLIVRTLGPKGGHIDSLRNQIEALHANSAAPLDPGPLPGVRARRGLSQREFSTMLSIDIDTLRNWEQGRNKRDQAAYEAIA